MVGGVMSPELDVMPRMNSQKDHPDLMIRWQGRDVNLVLSFS